MRRYTVFKILDGGTEGNQFETTPLHRAVSKRSLHLLFCSRDWARLYSSSALPSVIGKCWLTYKFTWIFLCTLFPLLQSPAMTCCAGAGDWPLPATCYWSPCFSAPHFRLPSFFWLSEPPKLQELDPKPWRQHPSGSGWAPTHNCNMF